MKQVDYLVTDLQRMEDKRERICKELGNGYDWQLAESLIAIENKIRQTTERIENKENGINKINNTEVVEVIDEAVNIALSKYYNKNNIVSGDITPEQLREWKKLVDKFGELFIELVAQNTN